MARRAFILYRRKLKHGKGYCAAWWDRKSRSYKRRIMLRTPEGYPVTTKDMALEIATKLNRRETGQSKGFIDYLIGFWDESSPYLQLREARKKPLSAMYLSASRSAIRMYVRPWLEEHYPELDMREVTPGVLEELLLHLSSRKLSPSRINGVMKAVRVPLSRANRLGYINGNPASQVERLPDPPPARRILELAEARRFFAQSWADPRYYAANLIAATTGLRLGEVRGLQVEDVREDSLHVCHNWQDREPEGRQLKGPKHSTLTSIKSRDVPMPPVLARVLRELVACNPYGDGFVIWGDRAGVPPSSTIILRHYKAGLRGIGIQEPERRERGLSFHAWRHFFNTRIRPLIPAYQLRMLTGHANEAMTDRYTAAAITDEQRQAVASVAAGLLPEP